MSGSDRLSSPYARSTVEVFTRDTVEVASQAGMRAIEPRDFPRKKLAPQVRTGIAAALNFAKHLDEPESAAVQSLRYSRGAAPRGGAFTHSNSGRFGVTGKGRGPTRWLAACSSFGAACIRVSPDG